MKLHCDYCLDTREHVLEEVCRRCGGSDLGDEPCGFCADAAPTGANRRRVLAVCQSCGMRWFPEGAAVEPPLVAGGQGRDSSSLLDTALSLGVAAVLCGIMFLFMLAVRSVFLQ